MADSLNDLDQVGHASPLLTPGYHSTQLNSVFNLAAPSTPAKKHLRSVGIAFANKYKQENKRYCSTTYPPRFTLPHNHETLMNPPRLPDKFINMALVVLLLLSPAFLQGCDNLVAENTTEETPVAPAEPEKFRHAHLLDQAIHVNGANKNGKP